MIQKINISADLIKEKVWELGRRGPYYRYINFPTEVTEKIEIDGNPFVEFNLSEFRKELKKAIENIKDNYKESVISYGTCKMWQTDEKICDVRKCNGCGKPLLLKNEWMEDGCPCNSPKGCNKQEKACDCPIDVLMTSGCKCGGK